MAEEAIGAAFARYKVERGKTGGGLAHGVLTTGRRARVAAGITRVSQTSVVFYWGRQSPQLVQRSVSGQPPKKLHVKSVLVLVCCVLHQAGSVQVSLHCAEYVAGSESADVTVVKYWSVCLFRRRRRVGRSVSALLMGRFAGPGVIRGITQGEWIRRYEPPPRVLVSRPQSAQVGGASVRMFVAAVTLQRRRALCQAFSSQLGRRHVLTRMRRRPCSPTFARSAAGVPVGWRHHPPSPTVNSHVDRAASPFRQLSLVSRHVACASVPHVASRPAGAYSRHVARLRL